MSLRPRAVVVVHRLMGDHDVRVLFAGGFFRQSDLGQLRIGVGHPRQSAGVEPYRQAEQRTADHEPRLMAGYVGESGAARAVANRVDAPVGCPKSRIHLNALGGRCNPRLIEAHAFDARLAAYCDYKMPAFEPLHVALGVPDGEADTIAGMLCLCSGASLVQRDAITQQGRPHQLDRLGIVPRQQARHLHQLHARAEPREGLRQLDPDRPAAQHNEVADFRHVVEHRLVGEVRHLVDARDRRNECAGTGRQHEAPRGNARVAGFDRPFVDELGVASEDRDAEALEPLHRIMRRDGGDRFLDVRLDPWEIDARRREIHAEAFRVTMLDRRLGRSQQGLRWNATIVQAIAAHRTRFDQDGPGAELRGAGGNRQARRARADNADIRFQHPHY